MVYKKWKRILQNEIWNKYDLYDWDDRFENQWNQKQSKVYYTKINQTNIGLFFNKDFLPLFNLIKDNIWTTMISITSQKKQSELLTYSLPYSYLYHYIYMARTCSLKQIWSTNKIFKLFWISDDRLLLRVFTRNAFI